MKDSYTSADLNPKADAVKHLRMTVQRALELVKEFDKLPAGQDWQSVPGTAYRRVFDDHYSFRAQIAEVWNRYKSGSIFSEILDLAANLPPSDRKKFAKELKAIEGRVADVATKRNRRRSRAG